MLWRPPHKSIKNILPSVYLASFFLSLHYSIALYVDSSFLSQFFGDVQRNSIFIIGSLSTLIFLSLVPNWLRRFGNYSVTIGFAILEVLTLLSLTIFSSPFLIAFLFVAHLVAVNILFYNLDIFIEHGSRNETTGKTRGLFLTAMNIAVLLGPFSAGFILSDSEYWKVYAVSAVLTLPFLFIIIQRLYDFCDPVYKNVSFLKMISSAWEDRNIRFITIANFLLQFFYAWMVIYTPIYLVTAMHFSWGEIGIIFTIMLLPFLFLELPLGKMADKWFGEKEILILGFLVMAVSTSTLSFLTEGTSLYFWATVLFVTRIGAAAVEIMTETYFFKKIGANDTELISFFRHTRPLSFIIGVASASAFLMIADMKYLFLSLGILTLSGIYFAAKIEDTK